MRHPTMRVEPVKMSATTARTTIKWTEWRMSTTNPFRGQRVWRVAWWVDDLGHRCLGRMHRPLLGRLCDALDRRLTRL